MHTCMQVKFLCVQQNEIDLHALLLMKEKDYSEIGLPKVSINSWMVSLLFVTLYCVGSTFKVAQCNR